MYKSRSHGLISDISKAELLKMRDGGMSNAAIAASLGCSKNSVWRLIGAQPKEISRQSMREAYRARTAPASSEGGYTVERKAMSFMPKLPDPEPVKAVLTVKRRDIQLAGAYMHYTVAADGSCVDVETEQGNVLISVPKDKLDAFIEELAAIKNHIGDVKPMEFWG